MTDRQQIVVIDEDIALRAEMVKYISKNPDYNITDFDSIGSFIDDLRIETHVDLVLLELIFNGQNILDHFYKIQRLVPSVKILITTENASESTLMRSIREGAAGYFVKSGDWTPLTQAVQRILADDAYVSPEVTKYLLKHLVINVPVPQDNKYGLTQREAEMLSGLLEGLRYKEMAAKYFVSINTVRHYVLRLYRKMGVNSRKQLLSKMKK
jgi:DNA-binding NarL/FixJ family response regulator